MSYPASLSLLAPASLSPDSRRGPRPCPPHPHNPDDPDRRSDRHSTRHPEQLAQNARLPNTAAAPRPGGQPHAGPSPHPGLAPRPEAHPSQLLDWLRLAARQVFGTELAARIEPYRACNRCVSHVRWCGEGVVGRLDPARPELRQLGITPLTPSLVLGASADPYPSAEALRRRTRSLLECLLRRTSSERRAHAGHPAPSAHRAHRAHAGHPAPSAHRAHAGHSAPSAHRAHPADAGLPVDASIPELEEIPGLLGIIGLDLSILTRSPLVLRDLDLLAELDQRHTVTVGVLIPAVDPALAWRLERGPGPASPPASPDERFELVRTLAAHGIAVEVVCTPIQPGINNSTAALRAVFDRAHEAGAFDVRPAPRHPSIRPTRVEAQQLLALFHRLRLERGFPRVVAARG